jgi:hypothetical protein
MDKLEYVKPDCNNCCAAEDCLLSCGCLEEDGSCPSKNFIPSGTDIVYEGKNYGQASALA